MFADPICGDGKCESPVEHQRFGRFGCPLDCGTFTQLTRVYLQLNASLDHSDTEYLSAYWNICSPTHQLCYYRTDQQFEANNQTIDM